MTSSTHCANCGQAVPFAQPHKVGECAAPDLTPEQHHWLLFDKARQVTGCRCGFVSDQEETTGYGDDVVAHLIGVGDRQGAARVTDAADEVMEATEWDGWPGRFRFRSRLYTALAQAATPTERTDL